VVIAGDKKAATGESCASHGAAGGNFCFSDAHVEWRRKPVGSNKMIADKDTDPTGVWAPGPADYEHDTCLVD
jgi:hypothetical protein